MFVSSLSLSLSDRLVSVMTIYKLGNYFSFSSIVSHLKWAWNFSLHYFLCPYQMPEMGAEDFNLGSCNHYYKQELREEDVECAICLCKIDDDDEIRELRCDHLFHKVCLDRWIGYRRSTCPICRSSLIPRRLVAGMEVILFNYCSFDDSSYRETWWLR
ncbi:E3 ubiquitin-protein ligase ATL41-like [Durio zibethinus]|uniref:E3 ubiquitin-protein ligase ATL41-like n=1 Tax=Durio zibethinus TaxID=66656 RepID=A0A6P5WQG5_DURZI|nr:E3 ubiquitin-protein ligase ATL41-like [Durio zibethinus]